MTNGYMIRKDKNQVGTKLPSSVDLQDLKYRKSITSQDQNHLYMVAMAKRSFGPMSRADKDALVEYVADVTIIR